MSNRPKRDFLFVDEHGDPGQPTVGGGPRFACIALHVTDVSLPGVVECFADLQFFRQHYKEVKTLHSDPRLRPKLATMLRCLAENGVSFSLTYLNKVEYTGPYLRPGEGVRFRNFQIRRLLEWHFASRAAESGRCEIIVDRFQHSSDQVSHLEEYLNANPHLPKLDAVTAVDSRYVEAIQVADLALSLFRSKALDGHPKYKGLDLSFLRARDVTLMSREWSP